MYEDKFI